MASAKGHQVEPRTFFLNEHHELGLGERSGGGKLPDFAPIRWDTKGHRISESLKGVADAIRDSKDPLKEKRYFVVARPVEVIAKYKRDKKQNIVGRRHEKTEFGGEHGQVFDRLGLDLLQVTEDGRAVVHAERERIDQLIHRSSTLGSLGRREQSRWATIDGFDAVPPQLRVDSDWLRSLHQQKPAPIIIELQPVLTRVEADTVIRAIAAMLDQRPDERLTGSGTDFSGRYWFRGMATQPSVRLLAKDFQSVQAIHPPLYSVAASGKGRSRTEPRSTVTASLPPNPADLPCVAVVDLGVPQNHRQLAAYRRGQFVPPDAPNPPIGKHGSFVASRVVFGDLPVDGDISGIERRCSFVDAMVGEHPKLTSVVGSTNRVDDKLVVPAIQGVIGAFGDVRVFNLSFGETKPLDAFHGVHQNEKRILMRELDNLVFSTDIVVVVAAGNSPVGQVPLTPYPDHHSDPSWRLGPMASGFNTLVCGAYVLPVSAGGLVQSVGWPSPFSRVGPGVCDAPVPSFGAPGGNTNAQYGYSPGLGVCGFSDTGLCEDIPGTSHAAPLLAREVAFAIEDLQPYCIGGARPFGVLVRAFLALTAKRPSTDARIGDLAKLTLGYGHARSGRLRIPVQKSAVLLWQGIINSTKDVVRVQLPIPRTWVNTATKPTLRLVVCYDPPVNESNYASWACRKVAPVLRLGPDSKHKGIRAINNSHPSYPIIDRRYALEEHKPGSERAAESDLWLLEFSYTEEFAYAPGGDVDPQQRVAFAAELFDDAANPLDPQPAMQALPEAESMVRLSVQPAEVRSPLIVRSRTR